MDGALTYTETETAALCGIKKIHVSAASPRGETPTGYPGGDAEL